MDVGRSMSNARPRAGRKSHGTRKMDESMDFCTRLNRDINKLLDRLPLNGEEVRHTGHLTWRGDKEIAAARKHLLRAIEAVDRAAKCTYK